jgi:2-C-methyl-D-erythritol 4-phosphate cytidylyltransferase / 2-C-methyl-D-erythritol 2,4-cyclodiphosphate synthase
VSVRGSRSGGTSSDPIEAIVVAAGSSSRMAGTDKLDAELDGRSVLRWSIEALAFAGVDRMVVVTSLPRVAALAAAPWLPDQVVAVVAGGPRRQESVAAGVAALAEPEVGEASGDDAERGAGAGQPSRRATGGGGRGRGRAGNGQPAGDPIILVHDAARPLVSSKLIRAVAAATAAHGAAIPVLPVAETLKRLDGERIGATVDRTNVVAAQTPQGVRRSLLERAYSAYSPYGPETWTDEASLLEACRIPVHAISGETTNLKVTVPVDMDLAQALLDYGLVPGRAPGRSVLAERPATTGGPPSFGRVGLGTDSHPFGPGEHLVLGGIRFEDVPRLSGHSDGDVALHSIADALLGAAALGDLGRLFPADFRTPTGIDSRVLLGTVAAKVRAAGWRPVNVDMTIVAARPKLGPALPEMAAAIALILGLDAGAVNVKASTGNLGGPEGAGRSISATAIVWLAPVGTVADGSTDPGGSAETDSPAAPAGRVGAGPVPESRS